MLYSAYILGLLFPLLTSALANKQHPLLNPTMPETNTNHNIFLSDVLSSDRSINIFAGFTRDFAQLSQRFENGAQNTTVLAPLNSAIMKLPRKPWEDRTAEGGVKADVGDGSEQAKENLKRFVDAHVVPVSPWVKGKEGKMEALGGGEVWWEEKDGKRYVSFGGLMRFPLLMSCVRRFSPEILKSVLSRILFIMVKYGC